MTKRIRIQPRRTLDCQSIRFTVFTHLGQAFVGKRRHAPSDRVFLAPRILEAPVGAKTEVTYKTQVTNKVNLSLSPYFSFLINHLKGIQSRISQQASGIAVQPHERLDRPKSRWLAISDVRCRSPFAKATELSGSTRRISVAYQHNTHIQSRRRHSITQQYIERNGILQAPYPDSSVHNQRIISVVNHALRITRSAVSHSRVLASDYAKDSQHRKNSSENNTTTQARRATLSAGQRQSVFNRIDAQKSPSENALRQFHSRLPMSVVPASRNSQQSAFAERMESRGLSDISSGNIGLSQHKPFHQRDIPAVERSYRTASDSTPVAVAHSNTTAKQSQVAIPTLDIADLDTKLWRRFEKRIRIEQERRGR